MRVYSAGYTTGAVLHLLHSFTPSLLHSFTPSLLHSFTPSLLHSFTNRVYSTGYAAILSRVCGYTQPGIRQGSPSPPSLLHSFTPSLLHSFTPSFLHSFTPPLLHEPGILNRLCGYTQPGMRVYSAGYTTGAVLHLLHSFTPSLLHSFTPSLLHSFTPSLLHSFTLCGYTQPGMRVYSAGYTTGAVLHLLHSFTPSLLHSFTPSLLHSFTPSLLHSFTNRVYSTGYAAILSRVCGYTQPGIRQGQSFTSFTPSLLHSFTPSLLHSFIPSLLHSSTPSRTGYTQPAMRLYSAGYAGILSRVYDRGSPSPPSLLHSFTPSLLHSFTPSFLHSFTPPLLHEPGILNRLCGYTQPGMRVYSAGYTTGAVLHLLHSFTPSLLHSFTPSLLHSFTPSLLHSFTNRVYSTGYAAILSRVCGYTQPGIRQGQSFTSFTPSLLHSFTPSLLHSFIPSLLHSSTPSRTGYTHSFTPSLLHSFTNRVYSTGYAAILSRVCGYTQPGIRQGQSFTSFTPSLLHSFTPSLLHSFTPSLLHSFIPSLLHSSTPSRTGYTQPAICGYTQPGIRQGQSFTSFTPSLLHSFTPSLLHSFTPSFLHSFTPPLLHEPGILNRLCGYTQPGMRVYSAGYTTGAVLHLLHSFTPSLLHSFTPSLLHSFTPSLLLLHEPGILNRLCGYTQPGMRVYSAGYTTGAVLHLLHSFTPSLLHSFTPSLLHSFTPSLLHSFTNRVYSTGYAAILSRVCGHTQPGIRSCTQPSENGYSPTINSCTQQTRRVSSPPLSRLHGFTHSCESDSEGGVVSVCHNATTMQMLTTVKDSKSVNE